MSIINSGCQIYYRRLLHYIYYRGPGIELVLLLRYINALLFKSQKEPAYNLSFPSQKMKTDICTVVAALLMSDLDTRTKDGLFPCEKKPWLVLVVL